jgi:hypothetical protein
MQTFTITRIDGTLIAALQAESLAMAISQAVNKETDLSRANLSGADLSGVNLSGAHLSGAHLSGAILPTGERWESYLSEVVPALLIAGGKTLAGTREHWECHVWDNCPMPYAFGAHGLKGVPVLLRPRVEQFIQFFDAKLIPCPVA